VHRAILGCAGGQHQHDLATAYSQGQTFFVTRVTVPAFAKESSLDIDAAHG
jgi:hypothetical protein